MTEDITKPCENCGKVMTLFPSQVGRKRFCSKKCQGYGRRIYFECLNCHKEFGVLPSRANNSKPQFCSKKCQAEHHNFNATETRTCGVCGSDFESFIEKSKEHLYCSNECANEARRIGSSFDRGGKITVECEVCGKPMTVWKYRRGTGKEKKYCSGKCRRIAISSQDRIRTSVEVPCDYCGKPVWKTQSKLEYHNHHFCNSDCYHAWDSRYKKTPKMIAELARRISNFGGPSGLEFKVAQWLDHHKVEYRQQAALKTYIVDFLIGDIYLEVNGCYWHGCQNCFSELNNIQKRRAHIDKSKRTYCKNRGLILIEVWEHEIEHDIDRAMQPLLIALASNP